MAGLVPAIQENLSCQHKYLIRDMIFLATQIYRGGAAWMAGTRPAMTIQSRIPRPTANAVRAAIYCRKTENGLSWPHEQSVLRHDVEFKRQSWRFGPRRAAKNFLAKIACNLLISLDSDERIQGNPSFSNPH
jgi:hypothetical protein